MGSPPIAVIIQLFYYFDPHWNHQYIYSLNLRTSVCTYLYKIQSLSTDWRVVEEYFKLLCSVLPQNNQLTIDKLKTIPQFLKDEGEQLSKIISSSSADVRKINEKIITYLIVKLCYNESDTSLVRLCDVMDESNDTHTYGMMYIYLLHLVVGLHIHYIRNCILALKLLEFLL